MIHESQLFAARTHPSGRRLRQVTWAEETAVAPSLAVRAKHIESIRVVSVQTGCPWHCLHVPLSSEAVVWWNVGGQAYQRAVADLNQPIQYEQRFIRGSTGKIIAVRRCASRRRPRQTVRATVKLRGFIEDVMRLTESCRTSPR